jgi:hypothetical protein
MNTTSISATSVEQLDTLLQDTIANSFQPTVAIAFSDPDFALEKSIQLFKKHGIQLVGCSSSGEICNDKFVENTFSVLLMEMNLSDFHVTYIKGDGFNYFEPGKMLGELAKSKFENPAIIVYSGGIGVDGESIVRGIKSTLDKEIPIYGGQGADHFKYIKVSTYTHEATHDKGISALIMDTDKIAVGGRAYSGWNDLGKTHQITKSDGNIVYEIDGKPALDLFNKYFPSIEYKQQEGSEKLFTIPGIYPLKIRRDNGVEFLRSGMIYDFEKKALILAGGVKDGDNFKFCPTPNFDVVETTINEFKNLASQEGEVDAIVINSCAGRHYAFGPMFEDEVEGLYKIWNKPTIGYMAYGEIGNTGDQQICEFHNVSCSLVTLREK